MSEVRNWIRQGRFVTLLGPGGINQTTVAVAAGHDADVRLIAALGSSSESAALIGLGEGCHHARGLLRTACPYRRVD